MEIASVTHVGLVRERQEDRVLTTDRIFAVADGMGGLDRGDFASTAVISALQAINPRPTTAGMRAEIREAIEIAHAMITKESRSKRNQTCGSTVAGFCYGQGTAWPAWLIFNAGDSRVYEYDGKLTQLSRDDSLVQDMLDAGAVTEAEAMLHPKRHIVTRCVGTECEHRPQFSIRANRGQIMCAMTDGISDLVWHAELEELFAGAVSEGVSLEELGSRLVTAALERGGRDNASVVLARKARYDGDRKGT